jgi:selenophosphate synthetase-related protein
LSPTIETARDINIIRLDQRSFMVVSCDSAGGIGSKAFDTVKVSPYVVGRFTARVALMETLAVGAKPICVASALAVEPTPTGNQILKGIKAEIEYASLSPRLPMINSTEKNIQVRQTGVGVMVVGLVPAKRLRVGRCKSGNEVLAVGLPHFGSEVLNAERQGVVADTRDIRTLLRSNLVAEVIPAGSKGILHEASVLAKDSKLRFKRHVGVKLDLKKSAGPATVTVCACAKSHSARVATLVRKPVARIGTLVT